MDKKGADKQYMWISGENPHDQKGTENKMEELRKLLQEGIGPGLYQIVVSNPRDGEVSKRKIRPVMLKGQLVFQTSSQVGTKVLHSNNSAGELTELLLADMENCFRQMEMETKEFKAVVLVSKKGKLTIKKKKMRQLPEWENRWI